MEKWKRRKGGKDTVSYEEIKFDPLPKRECNVCGKKVKIFYGWHPNYDVICEEGHISEMIWQTCPRCGKGADFTHNGLECGDCGWSVNW